MFPEGNLCRKPDYKTTNVKMYLDKQTLVIKYYSPLHLLVCTNATKVTSVCFMQRKTWKKVKVRESQIKFRHLNANNYI